MVRGLLAITTELIAQYRDARLAGEDRMKDGEASPVQLAVIVVTYRCASVHCKKNRQANAVSLFRT